MTWTNKQTKSLGNCFAGILDQQLGTKSQPLRKKYLNKKKQLSPFFFFCHSFIFLSFSLLFFFFYKRSKNFNMAASRPPSYFIYFVLVLSLFEMLLTKCLGHGWLMLTSPSFNLCWRSIHLNAKKLQIAEIYKKLLASPDVSSHQCSHLWLPSQLSCFLRFYIFPLSLLPLFSLPFSFTLSSWVLLFLSPLFLFFSNNTFSFSPLHFLFFHIVCISRIFFSDWLHSTVVFFFIYFSIYSLTHFIYIFSFLSLSPFLTVSFCLSTLLFPHLLFCY